MPLLLAATATPTAHTVSAWGLFAQLLLGLAVILAIIFVASRILAGRGRLSLAAARRQAPMSVLARQSIGKGASLAVVRAGSSVFLLGVTQHQVTRIDTLDPESVGATPDGGGDPGALAPADRVQGNWGSWIRQLQERSVRR